MNSVSHPEHYESVSGIECIEITRPLDYSLGNAVKYVWRYQHKGHPIEDLKKSEWFLLDLIRRMPTTTVDPERLMCGSVLDDMRSELLGDESDTMYDRSELVHGWKEKVYREATSRDDSTTVGVLQHLFFDSLAFIDLTAMLAAVRGLIEVELSQLRDTQYR